jgi:uncharacterized protein YneF (UPF0154 family)
MHWVLTVVIAVVLAVVGFVAGIAYRKNVAERKKIVANPQLRLDAIRLLVCR